MRENFLKKINTFSLNWTIVHKIDGNSPFYEYTKEDFGNINIELIITVKAFDEIFANTVIQRTSYVTSEIIYEKMKSPGKQLLEKRDIPGKLNIKDIDVLLTIGAGDIDTLVQPIEDKLLKERG